VTDNAPIVIIRPLHLSLMQYTRVFFRKKALKLLRDYWLNRYDDLQLREVLSKNYSPKYHAAEEVLDKNYLRLDRIDYLWYKGAFSAGIHLPSGRFYKEPYHYSNLGMGPRELVFPLRLLDQIQNLTLVGDWTRYQLCFLDNHLLDDLVRPNDRATERARIQVDKIGFDYAYPTLSRWYFPGRVDWKTPRPSLQMCLFGRLNEGRMAGIKLKVPMREIFWQALYK
jgi:hypothetical protein